MLISTRTFVDPEDNEAYGIVAVAVSLFVFAYSVRFGPIAILAFYSLWLPLIAVLPGLVFRSFENVFLVLVLPTVAVISTLWSELPAATLRGALQYASTIVCGIAAARLLRVETLVKGILIGSIIVLPYSFLEGQYKYDVVDGAYSFAGAFGSKNQLGLYSSLALIASIGTFFLLRTGVRWNIVALAVGALSMLALSLAQSATSTLTIIGSVGVGGVVLVASRLAPTARRITAAMAIVLVALALLWAEEMGAFESVLEIFGKDATLTGRTFLWREGIQIGHENPILGLGYYAFWQHDNAEAEDLWEIFYITSRTGFHFHNTLIEGYVALGLIGVLLLGLLTLGLIWQSIAVALSRPERDGMTILVALALLFAVRSIVEIDFFTPYTVGSFMVPYLLVYMAEHRRRLMPRRTQTPVDQASGLVPRGSSLPYWTISE